MKPKPTLLLVSAGIAVFGLSGCVDRTAQEQGKKTAAILNDPVKVVKIADASVETLTESLEITGDITAGEDTVVSAKQPGRIVTVLVKDGDAVTAGQLVATLDPTQAQAQVSQAEAQVGTALASMQQALAQERQANAALQQAIRNLRTKPDQSAAQVRQAEAGVRSARAQLQKAQAGARPEERLQAEANVSSAKTNLETQERELQRIETLVKEGAIAGNRLDQQRAATANARSQYQNAVQALNIIRNGTRSEDVEVLRAAVRQAEQALETARSAKELDPLLRDQVEAVRGQVAAARAQYQSAQSQLRSAQAQVAIAREGLSDTQIRAPFSGRVSGRPAQVGTIAGTQTTIVRIIGGTGVYFTGQIPSGEIARVEAGMPVSVRVDGVPDKTFAGSVAAISPSGTGVGRLFDVRISIPPSSSLRSGLFARGTITTRKIPNATVLPQTAIVESENKKYVFIVSNNVAKRIDVQTGLTDGPRVQVIGLPAGSRVVVEGQQALSDGAKVREDAVEAPAPGGSAPRS